MSKLLAGLLLACLLALAAAYAASPLLAFHQLQEAAAAGDRERLEALVDFPAVREGMKRQVESRVVKLARKADGIGLAGTVLGKLGAVFGDRAVDKMVTPESLATMVQLGETPRTHRRRLKEQGDDASAPAKVAVVTHYAYLTPERFRVGVAPADAPDAEIGLLLDRRAMFGWRVEEIELPGR